jgi:hypothetical protein
MKFTRGWAAVAVLVAFCCLGPPAVAQSTPTASDRALRTFQAGKFAEAGRIYSRIAARNPRDYGATLQLGHIALLANRLGEAQKWLGQALTLRPGDADAKIILAEAFYRRDDFEKAAAALEGVDVAHNELATSQYPTLNVAKLQSFKGETPYEVQGAGTSTRVKFVQADPLPVVTVRVNGGEEVTFFIDTGGSEVALDSDFAKELGLPQFGAVQGTFSGGEHAEVQNGRIASLRLGDWTIKNLPAAMLPLRQLSKELGVERIDGIIGTTLLYHFLATLDYRQGALVLRRKTARDLRAFRAAAARKSIAIPFWIAGDHFMVSWGRVNRLPSALLFVDTGLAGAGVKLGESALKQGDIKLEENKAYEGAGGGGKLKIVPYVVRRLSFGAARQDNVAGLYDGPFPWQNLFGFYLSGMVGHDFFKRYAVTFDFRKMRIYLQ